MNKLILLVLSCTLVACTGGDDNDVVGYEGIIDNIARTNLNSSVSPWNSSNTDNSGQRYQEILADGQIKRWDYNNTGLIPVKVNNVDIANSAMDRIEEELALVIFDRTSIQDTPDQDITRGIIVSYGTAFSPSGPACGHVSSHLDNTSMATNFYDERGEISGKFYLHLTSNTCNADTDIAIHEFGHVLGMYPHFEGFGIGPPIDNNFWNALYNIYNNDVGTLEEDLIIEAIY